MQHYNSKLFHFIYLFIVIKIFSCLCWATIVVTYVVGDVELTGCLPVEDGRPYRLTCPYSHTGSPVTWTIKSPEGSVQYNSTDCVDNNSTSCNNLWRDRVVLSSGSDADKRSAANFTSISVKDHGAVVACTVGRHGNVETISTCQLQVYHKPESPVCDMNKTGDNTVHIWCTTPKVFPGLVCNFAQFESKTKQMLSIDTGRAQSLAERTEDGYIRSTCSWTVYSLRPGKYQYFPVLQPNVTKSVRGTSVPVSPMTQVEIFSSSQQLFVYRDNLQPLSDDCRLEIPRVVFVCEARGFSRQPILELLIGRVNATPLTTIATETDEGNVYRTVFRMNEPTTDYPSENVVCLAKTPEQFISQEFRIDENDASQKTSEILLNSGVVHRLSCHTPRNRSDGSKVQISCFRGKELLFTSNTEEDSAEITLQLGYEAATCVCLNADERKCFAHETSIRVPDVYKKEDNDRIMTIVIIVSVCTLLTLILVIVCFLIILKRVPIKREKRKSYEIDAENFQEEKRLNHEK